MRNRFVRLCVFAALVASAAGAAFIVRSELASATSRHPGDIDVRVDQLHALVVETMRAEAAYVAPGQNPTPALVRFPEAVSEISLRAGELSALITSPAAIQEIRTFAGAASRLAQADAEARDHLLVGDVQTAAQVIFGKAGAATEEMALTLGRLREAERTAVAREAASAGLSPRSRAILGGVAALWLIVMFLFAVVPVRPRAVATRAAAAAPVDDHQVRDTLTPPGAAHAVAPASPIDVGAAADLCTDIARVESTDALNGLLSRAVDLLDADGIVVWIESAGQLFAAAAAGYSPDTVARLVPINRDDAHAVAAAWREAATETVDASSGADGAMAVPLFSGANCFGVFAVELKPGRERDADTRAVARLLAAQLATVVGGANTTAPAASAAGS